MIQRQEETTGDPEMWLTVANRMLVNTITYPIEYTKVLIQIGHEPIPPKPTTTLFGYPALGLPNIFKYVRYVKSVDGFVGCYRGLVPRLCSYTVSIIAVEKTAKAIKFSDEPSEDEDSEHNRKKKHIYGLLRDVISRVVGIIVSHPLEVIAVRSMAQFVGRETRYSGWFQPIIEVYRDSGISGYYAGIVPRLIANVATVVLVSGTTYAVNKYLIQDPELNTHTEAIMTFLYTTLTYPFHVVSHCMAVNNCGLVAGLPPQMPVYDGWTDCWVHLSTINQLKRGSSILWRYYTGPTNGRDWGRMSTDKSKLKLL